MRFCSIASGSSGNCIFVEHEGVSLLIDAGITCKRIEEGVRASGGDPASLSGIFVTHEHSDHIQGIPILAARYGLKIYATEPTINYMKASKSFARISEDSYVPVAADQEICLSGIVIKPFTIYHDAACPVSYRVETAEGCLGMATDLGHYDDYIVEHLSGCDALYLESNHDINMLMVGRYAYSLKIRIAGDYGHLSNESATELILSVQNPNLHHIVLAHLSQDNNLPELAYETVKSGVLAGWKEAVKPEIIVASRHTPIQPITIQR